jgi:hypothetical protein
VAGRPCKTERDRALAAAHIEDEGAIAEVWQEEVRVVPGAPFLQGLLEAGAHRMIGTVPPSALHAEPVT